MAFAFERRVGYYAQDHRYLDRPSHRPLPSVELPRTIAGGAAAALVMVLGVWALFDLCQPSDQIDGLVDRLGGKSDRAATLGDRFNAAVTRGDKLQVAKAHLPAANLYASLFDSRFSLGGPLESFVNSTASQDEGDAAATPLAPPVQLASRNTRAVSEMPSRGDQAAAKRTASATARLAARDGAQQQQANAAVDTRTFFEKLFGKPAPVTLAYAATDDAGLGTGKNIAGRYDRWTAVYDISAHTVYMPDGSQLEAHSGLGNLLDDPQHPDQRMRGVTPPNLYNLELREAPFHGVRALRMIPQDERKTFGRSGLLAHTYMLGPKGDSNGCVSFRNYDAFLQAYLKQDVKRLAVVTHLE
jgi:hypothetical protein